MTNQEVDDREHNTVRTLRHDYAGCDWVDNTLVHLRDDGLRAKVHHFHKLHEESERKLEEVCIANDRIADIYLELAPCQWCLLCTEVAEQVKGQHGEAVQLISPWTFEHGRSA